MISTLTKFGALGLLAGGVSGPADTVLLQLSFDGADGSTDFPDDTGRHTVSAVGSAQVDTAQSKFGTGSLLLGGEGSGDYASVPSSEDFHIGTGDFTVEAQVRLAVIPLGTGTTGCQWFIGGSSSNALDLSWCGPNQSLPNNFYVYLNGSGHFFSSWSPTIDTWYHLALCRSGTNLRMFVDGVQIGSTKTSSDDIPLTGLYIGQQFNGDYGVDGWMDEVQVSSEAKYTANFTPPVSAYP